MTRNTTTAPDVRTAGRITDALHLIARHYPATADPPRTTTSTTHTTPSSKPPMPAAVLSLRRETLDTLTSLALVICDDRDLNGPATHDGHQDVIALTRWLTPHADWLAGPQQPDDPEATAHELEHLARRIREVALQQRPSVVDVGPCPQDDPNDPTAHCGGQLRAVVRQTDDLLPSAIRCTDHPAEHTWPTRQWEDLARHVEGVVAGRAWLPVTDAAHITGVPARTIRRWVAEGRVTKWSMRIPALVSVTEVIASRDAASVPALTDAVVAVSMCSSGVTSP